ncbi:trehalose-6-phosphate synthase, partial [Microbacterium sp. B24]|uniref:trehalose-6-phosphate synthase n=1 Tax=Microbacterium sp. B24 TaxID=95616 RepID=UPI001EF9E04C
MIVVSNRLPVDHDPSVEGGWRRSPGGLVAALEPVLQRTGGAWVGWPGTADLEIDPFELEGMSLVPVALSAEDVALYYEGFSNDTIWPLYHDVISPPAYHREWWEACGERCQAPHVDGDLRGRRAQGRGAEVAMDAEAGVVDQCVDGDLLSLQACQKGSARPG